MGFGMTFSEWDVCVNLHGMITNGDSFKLYALTGLCYSTLKATATVAQTGTTNDDVGYAMPFSSIGLNAGGGFDVKLTDNLFFNCELKIFWVFLEGNIGYRIKPSAGLIYRF
jgi:opacity protein-like surface antigen